VKKEWVKAIIVALSGLYFSGTLYTYVRRYLHKGKRYIAWAQGKVIVIDEVKVDMMTTTWVLFDVWFA